VVYVTNLFPGRTSPEEFLSRLAKAEEEKRNKLQKGSTSSPQEKEFSLPTKPKKLDKKSTGMLREKVPICIDIS
jgi:hypothetical protein